ncbi:zonular occludens toxin domain-containing protein [Stenotrophomonas sp. LARHCG68]
MLVFNEGVPRAGKSYDAVKSHILPSLKKGRRVFARLNGLDKPKIAEYLKMPLADVDALLTLVDTKDVRTMFACVQDDTGKWCIPDEFKDALVVIDEVHEFYVNERLPLPAPIENFWALLGQNGGDAVIMTQWINRVHQAIRARIERKNVFQKLTAIGFKNKYRVSYFHTTSPGKYERVGGKTEKYDPAIYPLYHGYAPGSENTEVYEEGATNVWLAMLPRAAMFGIAGLVGAYFFLSFFFDFGKGKKEEPAAAAAQAQAEPVQVFDENGQYVRTEGQGGVVAAGANAVEKVKPDPYADLSAEQRYVAELADKGRVRLASRAEIGERTRGWVEWVANDGETLESLEVAAVEALGYSVTWTIYGVRMSAGKHVIVATPWPREIRVRETEQRLYNLSPSGGAAGIASVASEAGGAAAPGAVIGYTAGKRADVFPRSPQATISGYTPPTSSL